MHVIACGRVCGGWGGSIHVSICSPAISSCTVHGHTLHRATVPRPSLHSLFIGGAAGVLWLHHIWQLGGAGEGVHAKLLEHVIWGRKGANLFRSQHVLMVFESQGNKGLLLPNRRAFIEQTTSVWQWQTCSPLIRKASPIVAGAWGLAVWLVKPQSPRVLLSSSTWSS